MILHKQQIKMSSVYVLRLRGGKYYIGKSLDPRTRYKYHCMGKGSEWTRLHAPLQLIHIEASASIHHENNLTKDYMIKYGIDNVRGGAYCKPILSSEIKQSLEFEILSLEDRCYECGEVGHYTKDCNFRDTQLECEIEWKSLPLQKEFSKLQ